jgi:hypothetical protein
MPDSDPHANFRRAVADSRLVDPMRTFRGLSETTGIPVEDLVHHALARWASAGSEALLFIGPQVLTDLFAARRAGDWDKVGGIVDWLQAAWEQAASR